MARVIHRRGDDAPRPGPPSRAVRHAHALELKVGGALEVILKEGERVSAAPIGDRFVEERGFGVPEVDPVGAGDAHVAGCLAGSLWGLGVRERFSLANAMGAYSVMTLEDHEGLPGAAGVRELVEGKTTPPTPLPRVRRLSHYLRVLGFVADGRFLTFGSGVLNWSG